DVCSSDLSRRSPFPPPGPACLAPARPPLRLLPQFERGCGPDSCVGNGLAQRQPGWKSLPLDRAAWPWNVPPPFRGPIASWSAPFSDTNRRLSEALHRFRAALRCSSDRVLPRFWKARRDKIPRSRQGTLPFPVAFDREMPASLAANPAATARPQRLATWPSLPPLFGLAD